MLIKNVIEDIKKTMNYSISYKKAWHARAKAIKMVFGDWDESYRQLPKFMHALQTSNPGTIVTWKHRYTGHTTIMPVFHFVFWSFKPVIDGFRYCRPVITIDGIFLYGKYTGALLVATIVTANGKILPLAFAVVDRESLESWSFFIQNIKEHIVMDRQGVTLISDRAESILAAMRRHWLNPSLQFVGYHRHCLRHVCSNFNTHFKNKELKQLLWKAGSADQRRKCNGYLDQIQEINQEAINWVHKMNPEDWALAYDGGYRWGVLTSNDAECFNSVLKGARNLPISAMVEFTFRQLVKYFDEMGAQAETDVRNEFQYPREMQRTMEEGIARGNTFKLISYDRPRRVFEVQTSFRRGRDCNRQIVRMNQPTCSCGKYEIRHYPCSHMLAVMSECGDNPFQYVDPIFRLPVYMKVWETKFNPIPHQVYWDDPQWNLLPNEVRLR
ncbi:uncharacterized protein LOC114310822 [Camellia sinensis]|uniref:uncharacterized protein LOC114310822 n=1 Tax=Camellia sinensis TaxID=4442 RepID=UPI001036699C|nr:uncharacterized protein LOC114310822 [Camellia sinensis]